MKSIRFMSNNYLERVFTYSSQITAFPAINAFNKSRSKVWKPGGNFEVTALNNLIYINDGTNKTVTLTVGAYTYATLASHIQTRLNFFSSNWTCAYNNTTTFKFTINRSSGTAVLRKSQTTSAAWDMLGFTGNIDISSNPFIADEQRNHTSEWVTCDVGVPQLATFAAIISGIDEIFTLSSNATVKLRANNIDYWVSPPVDITIPVTELGVFAFLDDTVTASYRFWRFEIMDRQNYLGPEGLELAYTYIGDHNTVTLTNLASGFEQELVDPSVQLQSEAGATFYEVKPRYRTISSAQIQLITNDEYREIKQLFYDLGVRTPFFVSIDPGTEVTATIEELTNFVSMAASPTFEHVFRGYYNINFDMREAF